MEKEIKDKTIALRVTEAEKREVEQMAKDNGFTNVSAFIYWLCKKYGRKDANT
jgi:hypothetical protein